MKLTKEQLKKTIKEILLEQDAQDPNAVFGQYLFGPDQKSQKANTEPNTSTEEKFLSSIRKHYNLGKSQKLGQYLINVVKPELQKGNYTDVLAPPANTTVYRGMILSSKQFAEIAKMDEEDIHADPNKGWYVGSSGVINPKKHGKFGCMSWTTDPKVAARFSVGGREGVYVVFTANTSNKENNFFINPNMAQKKFTDRSPFVKFKIEKEVISVGPVRFTDVAFYYGKDPLSDEKATQLREAQKALISFWRNQLGPWVINKEGKGNKNFAALNSPYTPDGYRPGDLMYSIRGEAFQLFTKPLQKIMRSTYMKANKAVLVIDNLMSLYALKRHNKNTQEQAFKCSAQSAKYAIEAWSLMKPVSPKRIPNPKQSLLFALGLKDEQPKQTIGYFY